MGGGFDWGVGAILCGCPSRVAGSHTGLPLRKVVMRLHLAGHLSWYDPQKRSRIEVRLAEPTLLVKVLRDLGIPHGEIAVVVVNGTPFFALGDIRVSDDDQVELFPPVGGG